MNVIDMPEEPQRPKREQSALERLQEEMQRPLRQLEEIQRPLRQWEEMQRQLSPLRHLEEMQEQIRRAATGYQLKELVEQSSLSTQLREIIEQSTLPRRLQDLLDRDSAATQAQSMLEQYLPKVQLGLNNDAIAAAANAIRPTLDHQFGLESAAMAAAASGIKLSTQHEEWFNKLQLQATGGMALHDLARQLELANPALTALEEAQRSLGSLVGTFRDIDFTQLALVEDEEHETEQAAQAITLAATTELTPAAVAQIVAAIGAQQNPIVRLTLLLLFSKLIEMIISGIISSIIGQFMPQIASQSPPQAVKSIKEVARTTVDSQALLTEYRIVTAKALSLRQNPKTRSPELGHLGFGKVVKLVKKDKDFALVLWRDTESGTEIQGWVFARYLEKFT